MDTPAAFLLLVAVGSAALMGIAIQRGATCMVAAVDEVLVYRRFDRALALAEAAAWVGGLVGLAVMTGLLGRTQMHVPAGFGTLVGGIMLGLGAWTNQACLFGTVARIGTGQWEWWATPFGFFLGCLVPLQSPVAATAASMGAVPLAVLSAAAFVILFGWRALQTLRAGDAFEHLWHPHRATLLIAITFVTTMVTVGTWAYSDAIAALARPAEGMDPRLAVRSIMVAALFGGAVLGGWIAGQIRQRRLSLLVVLRCLAGGAMMGVGAILVPGGNDGLIMLGLPMLLPHAWVAVAAMVATIALATIVSVHLRSFHRTGGVGESVDRR